VKTPYPPDAPGLVTFAESAANRAHAPGIIVMKRRCRSQAICGKIPKPAVETLPSEESLFRQVARGSKRTQLMQGFNYLPA